MSRSQPRPIDLKRKLLVRVTLFAFALCAVAAALTVEQAVTRIRVDIQRTGSTIRQLIEDEAAHSTSSFDRRLSGLDLSGLAGIGRLVHFCATIDDLWQASIAHRCFGEVEDDHTVLDGTHPLAGFVERLVGKEAIFRGAVTKSPGVKVAELTVAPHYDSEAAALWRQLRNIIAITGGILLLNVLIYLPVRRALEPTEQVLGTLAQMESGDLSARMPAFELIELNRIGEVFNHLAERLQLTQEEQQRLARRLLEVREEERRHLARELHDELGQALASINAEAAFAGEVARTRVPELAPCAESIARSTAHMMEALQQILYRLRPVGLEEFGLTASLDQLVQGWERRTHGQCSYALKLEGELDDLPDEINVSIYRIVQESLTNAAKHGKPSEVAVRLTRAQDEPAVALSIEDDGQAAAAPEPEGRSGGFGLLGMRERVQSLGGSLAVVARKPRGLRIDVRLPLPHAAFAGVPA